MDPTVNAAQLDRPRGVCHTKLDEKGRIKLSADIQRYLATLGETKFFVTTLDGRIGRIYPISAWAEQEDFLNHDPESDQAERILFIAHDLGGDSDLDSQGRVLVPSELRRALNIENQPVHLQVYRKHIRIYSDSTYQVMRTQAFENPESTVRMFEKKGLQ